MEVRPNNNFSVALNSQYTHFGTRSSCIEYTMLPAEPKEWFVYMPDYDAPKYYYRGVPIAIETVHQDVKRIAKDLMHRVTSDRQAAIMQNNIINLITAMCAKGVLK